MAHRLVQERVDLPPDNRNSSSSTTKPRKEASRAYDYASRKWSNVQPGALGGPLTPSRGAHCPFCWRLSQAARRHRVRRERAANLVDDLFVPIYGCLRRATVVVFHQMEDSYEPTRRSSS